MGEHAVFAAGCFWGVEDAFRLTDGVLETEVGYTGGAVENPTYENVCNGKTGHAEAVRLKFDPAKVSYEDLVRKFFSIHNPTTKNMQGPDVGEQYRSVIFYADEKQKDIAEKVKAELERSASWRNTWPAPIVTEIILEKTFYRAEEYHQKYFLKNGGGVCHS